MKKNLYVLVFLILSAFTSNSQFCGSTRFDKEVFSTVNVTANVTFGASTSSGGGTTLLNMDIYEPDGDTMAMRPVIIWVHGGSFVGGSKNDADVVSLSEHFAKRGYVCASIEYRLGFSVFPPTAAAAAQTVFMAVQDMKAAVRFFRKDAATTNTYHIDPTIIFGGGSSAGAFAALHLAYLDQVSEIPVGVDTNLIGGLEGMSGNPGYASNINAVIDLCGALGDKTYMHAGDVPFVAMHGNIDGTVPYATAIINLLGIFPIMTVDGSFSIADYANSIGLQNEFYTYYGADHVPYFSNTAYMDTTVRFVSNFLYRYLGCTPSDPTPFANTSTTGVQSITDNKDISVYPNPGNGIFTFSFSDEKLIEEISVFDVSGRKLIEVNENGDNYQIDMTGFSPGIYFYKVKDQGRFYEGKILVN